jgi:hypothetical protein
MKDIEENYIFIFYLPTVIGALLIQLLLAGLILFLNRDILECTVWSEKDYRSFLVLSVEVSAPTPLVK